MPSVANLMSLLRGFASDDDETARSVARTLQLLQRAPDPFDRTCYDPGHVTASAIVLSPEKTAVLLIFHRRLERWLQPGGHVKPSDETAIAAARREALEETGAILDDARDVRLVGVDVHDIPPARGEPFHRHHDVTFGFTSPSRTLRPAGDGELVWCPIGALHRYHVDASVEKSVRRALWTL